MSDHVKKVLLVDDDPGLLFPLSKDLSMNQDIYRLVLAENGQEALEILAKECISLVVSDVNMPGINGFDLLAAIREQYPHIGVILMTAYGTDKMRRIVKDCGCLHFLEKPFRFDKLKELIQKQIAEKETGFNGTLKNILLTDLIQICCIAGADMAIKVTNGASEGIFYIEAGEVIHAECEEEQGEAALFKVIGWKSGSFESFNVDHFPEPTINKPYMYLLMEGSRQSDESDGEIPEEKGEEDEADFDNMEKDLLSALGGNPEISPNDDMEAPTEETPPEKVLRVMIVDDSAIMCRILSDTLSESDRIQIVGNAKNGQEALQKIDELKPDLITLDVNMPIMGGRTALKHIMIKNRCPVVIISSLNSGSYENILDFLLLGAVDFIGKPVNSEDVAKQQRKIIEKIINAGKAYTHNFIRYKPAVAVNPDERADFTGPGKRIVLVHSGAGGYVELVQLIARIPAGIGACLVVLHDMPQSFIKPLSYYLQRISRLNVSLLASEQPLLDEHCYICPPDAAFFLEKKEQAFVANEADRGEGENIGIHPRLAHNEGNNVMTVLLSGAMVGEFDDLTGLKEMDSRVIVKDPKSCMVPHPLEKAIRSGLATEIVGLNEIAGQIIAFHGPTDKIGS